MNLDVHKASRAELDQSATGTFDARAFFDPEERKVADRRPLRARGDSRPEK